MGPIEKKWVCGEAERAPRPVTKMAQAQHWALTLIVGIINMAETLSLIFSIMRGSSAAHGAGLQKSALSSAGVTLNLIGREHEVLLFTHPASEVAPFFPFRNTFRGFFPLRAFPAFISPRRPFRMGITLSPRPAHIFLRPAPSELGRFWASGRLPANYRKQ